MRPIANRFLVAIFIAAISMPLAATLAGVSGADAAAENRELAAFPATDGTWRSVARLPQGIASWFDDHFAFRAHLVKWNGELEVFGLHRSPSAHVLLGEDEWLFYADDGALEDMTGAPLMTNDEIANWRESLNRTDRWLRAQGIAFVFTIAPDKHVLYPDRLPRSIERTSHGSRQDQLMDALSDSQFALDLRPALVEAREHDRIYHVTDTHWNDAGVFVAYRQIIEAMRRQTSAVPPAWPLSSFDVVSRTSAGGDLAAIVGLKRVLSEQLVRFEPKRPRRALVVEPPGAAPAAEEGRLVTEIPGSDLPRLLVFRDSFVSPLVPFLSEHFSRAVYLWQKDVVAEQIAEEKPDVVLYEMVGRRLYTFIPSPELIPN
jgi:hypothetical protein